jgi:hypothetical protein
MSRGMQQMRLIVMEFGRFTIDSAVEGQTGSPLQLCTRRLQTARRLVDPVRARVT